MRRLLICFLLTFTIFKSMMYFILVQDLQARTDDSLELLDMSIEELINLEITSVSRKNKKFQMRLPLFLQLPQMMYGAWGQHR